MRKIKFKTLLKMIYNGKNTIENVIVEDIISSDDIEKLTEYRCNAINIICVEEVSSILINNITFNNVSFY